jgi:phospholipid/cholesterol/gamma-HCH transport system substrate-binding protein
VTENLKKATSGEGDDSTTIGRILLNIEDLTADLRDITSDKKDDIESTIDHIHNVAKSLDNFINDESPDGFKYNFKKMSKSLGKVDSILTNVDEITGKINSGKGTIGKLVNDESTVEELNKAISGVNNMLDKARRFELTVDYHSELLANSMVKSYIGVSIQPGPDRFYNVAVVSDPKGSVEHVDQVSSANGGSPTTLQNRTVYHEKLKFSIQFGKNFYDLAVRAGLFESTAGIGVDYHLFNRKLRVTSEFFDFARTEGPNLRAYVRWKFYSVFYAVAGGDDIMNTKSNINGTGASGFLGAGLDFTNEDLKLLLGKVGF